MKLRLRTMITGSKTMEHAKYNLSFQLTADSIRYIEPELIYDEKVEHGRRLVTAEAYILNASDRKRIVELLDELTERNPDEINNIAEVKHVIGFSEFDVKTGMPNRLNKRNV